MRRETKHVPGTSKHRARSPLNAKGGDPALPNRLVRNGECFAKQLEADPAGASSWNAKRWSNLVAARPEFADRCPWEAFKGGQWALVLCYQPQFADKCPWSQLDGFDWSRLLSLRPQFADKCDWTKLDAADWGRLVEAQPQFADKKPNSPPPPPKRKQPAQTGRLVYVNQTVVATVRKGKVVSVRYGNPKG